ncbi:MAG TPA: glycosyltransferase family 39 protein [Vicinamibacteria bacterium]|nr:glycosyltransferase family 39 protein [Vicinamibacteria bacterium]
MFVRYAWLTARSPWSRDYGEGCVLGMAQLLAERGSYFPRLHDYPYLVANYPPVFVAAVAAGQKAFGPSLAFPRLLGLLATIGILVVLFLLLRRLLRDAATALALAAVFAVPWFVTTWAALGRVDTTAILFSLAGLAVVLRHGPTARAWPALLLFWLAFFTKQNAVLAPAALAVDLLLARDRRLGRAALAYALPLAALFGLLVLATQGEAWRHLVPYTAAAIYEPGRMGLAYLHLGVIASPLLVAILAALVAVPGAFALGAGRVLLVYFLLNLANLATIAKAGAAQNYFLEPWAATLLLAGFALRALADRRPRVWRWRWAALLLAGAVARHAYPSLDRLPQALRAPEKAREFPALVRLIRETPGDVLSENLSLLVVNDRPVLLEPFGVFLIAREGLLSTDRLTADCQRGRFPLVIVEHRMWEIPGFGDCLASRYQPAGDYGPYKALRPRLSSR